MCIRDRTKHQAKKLAKQLTLAGIPAVDLHGNLSQPARERNLEAFSTGAVRVLVATDIAARGIHVDAIELVVHVDPPAEHKAYLHRSGRTARAGSGGDVVTLVLPEQASDFRALSRQAKITATPQSVRAGTPVLERLVGELPTRVKPSAAPAAAAPSRTSSSRGGQTPSGRRHGPRGQAPATGRAARGVDPTGSARRERTRYATARLPPGLPTASPALPARRRAARARVCPPGPTGGSQ